MVEEVTRRPAVRLRCAVRQRRAVYNPDVISPNGSPEFPLTITSHRDGDAWTFESTDELLDAMVVFSTDDPAQGASVIDGRGRLVRLVVQDRSVVTLELVPGWPSLEG